MLNISEEEIRELATNDLLLCLERNFNASNKSNEFYSLPVPDFTLGLEENIYIGEQDPNARVFYDTYHEMLNEEQKEIKMELCDLIDNNKGGLYMIDAPGGTGKTFLSNIF